MTDEERKQFINEYCRNVGNIKIKRDDCKFVEDCVDYGWQECKKFTPKPSEPMTNEEYLRSLNTEQLAWMISLFVGNAIAKHDCGNDEDIKPIKWVEWLKQPHHGE